MTKGIDVSSYQGVIDWDRVETDFVIIRLGYGDDTVTQDDTQFMNNVNGCIKRGIPFGVYLYSYAKRLEGEESIQSEVAHCLRRLGEITEKPFGVFIDMEDDGTKKLGLKVLTNFALFFCSEIEKKGYKAGVYANENWFRNYLNINDIMSRGYLIWCAKYSNNKPEIRGSYDIWQYSDSGKMDGIIGNVDLNIMERNIIDNDDDRVEDGVVNVFYRVKTVRYGWLPEVRNLDDYAGYRNDPITAIAIRVNKGTVKYRVHVKNGEWYSYVTGYDINDVVNGYAGNGKRVIDAVQVYYVTPDDIRPYKKAKYWVNDYAAQYDTEVGNGMDGYAGKLGIDVTKFKMMIE